MSSPGEATNHRAVRCVFSSMPSSVENNKNKANKNRREKQQDKTKMYKKIKQNKTQLN